MVQKIAKIGSIATVFCLQKRAWLIGPLRVALGWRKLHRRHILPDYKQALAWASPEWWDGRLKRNGRHSDFSQKGTVSNSGLLALELF
jgi:hypothetical protein